MAHDVVVIGAGLAGLSAARDLMNAGTDVVVLEARARPGGRVEQTFLADGRPVQLGGEVIGEFHTAYRTLVGELGLTLEASFQGRPGLETTMLVDGRHVASDFEWLDASDLDSYRRVEDAFSALCRTVDPDDPWSHPDADRLDQLSVATWMRSEGATTNAVRAHTLAMLALAAESPERTSLLSDLRKESAAGSPGFYNYDVWESLRVAEGSATVAERMALELGARVRYSTPVSTISVGPERSRVTTAAGEVFDAAAVVCAVPAGPLRRISVLGVSDERLASLHRQRHALAAKVVFAYDRSFWEDNGQNGSAYSEEGLMGGTWVQREGIISALVPPERFGPYLASPRQHVEAELADEMIGLFGDAAAKTSARYIRNWGTDQWTQGYITAWRPGDVMAVGPLHGTHEPPFFVCGSDQWVCGYMEGAVRTGRSAAAAALARG